MKRRFNGHFVGEWGWLFACGGWKFGADSVFLIGVRVLFWIGDVEIGLDFQCR